jgi:hypothetical protein
MMRNLIAIAALLSLVLMVGCTTTMVPVGYSKPVGAAAVDIFVGQKFPRFFRNDPYTPLYVTIRNNTSQWVQLRYGMFTLYDPAGRPFVIAPVDEVHEYIRFERWTSYYAPFYPHPVRSYIFREGRLKPNKQYEAVMFFNQATRFGQGTYRLVADIPQNGAPIEFRFRLD